jgi:hypothetical protein
MYFANVLLSFSKPIFLFFLLRKNLVDFVPLFCFSLLAAVYYYYIIILEIHACSNPSPIFSKHIDLIWSIGNWSTLPEALVASVLRWQHDNLKFLNFNYTFVQHDITYTSSSEFFKDLKSACLSKFHEKPCYYLSIIYIKMFETIVVLTYVYSEHFTGHVFLALFITLYNASSLEIPLNSVSFVSLV